MSDLSLDLLFSNPADKEVMITAFSKVGEDVNDPYAHLTDAEKEEMNANLQLIGQKNRLGVDDYQPDVQVVHPELSDVTHSATQVEVLKKFGTHLPGEILDIAGLDNILFLLKFNIVKTI